MISSHPYISEAADAYCDTGLMEMEGDYTFEDQGDTSAWRKTK